MCAIAVVGIAAGMAAITTLVGVERSGGASAVLAIAPGLWLELTTKILWAAGRSELSCLVGLVLLAVAPKQADRRLELRGSVAVAVQLALHWSMLGWMGAIGAYLI